MFIHSPVDGLGFFQIEANVNKAAMNIFARLFVDMCFHLFGENGWNYWVKMIGIC